MSEAKNEVVKKKKPSVASVTVLNSAAAVASPSKLRRRHVWLIMSLIACVIAPTVAAVFYLFSIAENQFSSKVSFSIRSEQSQNPLEAFSGLGQLPSGTSTDASILNEYLRSQKLVEDVSSKISLKDLYSKPDHDPFFAFNPNQPIEELVEYFATMNYVTFDAGTGLLDVEAFAFTADDSQLIATAIFDASAELVEHLSKIAQEDTTRIAKFELEAAKERLVKMRQVISAFRSKEQIVDPLADLESQMGVLTALQNQLASTLVESDLLLATSKETDPRVVAIKRKTAAIERRIEQERNKVGQTTVQGDSSLATVVGNFESLLADREFAERAYQAANVAYETAQAEARRKSKYLVAHIPATKAESSQFPNRPLWALSVFGACLLIWSVTMLTVFAMLDRR